MSDMEEVYKAEVETLRKLLGDCYDLLFRYGYTFDKEDREKTTKILCSIKYAEASQINVWLGSQPCVKYGEKQ